MIDPEPPGNNNLQPVPGARVVAFALILSVLAGIIVALVPILVSRKVRLAQGAEGIRINSGAAGRRPTAHDGIVALQIAMALSMLISAALLVQSLRGLNSVDPGFRTDNLLLASLDPRAAGYDANRIDSFWRTALERVREIPSGESAHARHRHSPGARRPPPSHRAGDRHPSLP